MIAVEKDIRAAYFSLLNGSLTYNSLPVPVYSYHVPNGQDPDLYVLLGQQNTDSDNTKQSFNADSSIEIEVVSLKVHNNAGDDVDDVSAQILAIVYPKTAGSVISSPNFQIISTEMAGNNKGFPEFVNNRVKITRYITFEHRTFQMSA